MTFRFWPQSLFGRLMAASIIALLLAQVVSLVMIARERERFILQGSVREWSRRVVEVTSMLQGMDDTERSAMISRLTERPWRFGHWRPDARRPVAPRDAGPPDVSAEARQSEARPDAAQPGSPADAGQPHTQTSVGRPGMPRDAGATDAPGVGRFGVPREAGATDAPGVGRFGVPREAGQMGAAPDSGQLGASARPPRYPPERRGGPEGPPPEDTRSLVLRAPTYPAAVVPFTKAGDFEPGFEVGVARTADPNKKAIPVGGPLFSEAHDSGVELYDARIKFPDGYSTVFRVTRYSRGAPLPRGLFMNLALLVLVLSIALWVVARSITRPLSELAKAADSVGRDLRQPKLAESGARELRNAARAFNTMQDRMQRYLDSRSRVLAAMSHDLKTPLTRLRLQVEMLDAAAAQVKLGRQLDEMESMVHVALALFRGLDDNEAFTAIDINEMLATLQSEFAEMNAQVTLHGQANRSILGKPQALRRCLTNLIANAVKFGSQATVIVEDGTSLVIRIRDEGPGIPDEELERVFEPFYRLESSRNRDTGGCGLVLSIARDVIQAHGGSLVLRNLPVRGLEAIVTLPRTRGE